MPQQTALTEAIKRFPWRLKQWREHGMTSKELHEIVPMIIHEYRLIMKEREKQEKR